MPVKIICAKTESDLDEVRRLFREYAAELKVNLCFQGFEQELRDLPGKYAPPNGTLLLAKVGESFEGCVALRRIDAQTSEMKRLFVRPEFKGKGIGRLLAETIIREAQTFRYRIMRLDTLDRLKPALSLYDSLGFRPIKAYYDNPHPGVVYLELDLGSAEKGPK